jgi:hypothetical protein
MIVSIVLTLLAGVLLGQWFKVFILLPVIAVALIGAIGGGIAGGGDAWSIGLTAICVTIALQMGYLIGSAGRGYRISPKTTDLAHNWAHHAPQVGPRKT